MASLVERALIAFLGSREGQGWTELILAVKADKQATKEEVSSLREAVLAALTRWLLRVN